MKLRNLWDYEAMRDEIMAFEGGIWGRLYSIWDLFFRPLIVKIL